MLALNQDTNLSIPFIFLINYLFQDNLFFKDLYLTTNTQRSKNFNKQCKRCSLL